MLDDDGLLAQPGGVDLTIVDGMAQDFPLCLAVIDVLTNRGASNEDKAEARRVAAEVLGGWAAFRIAREDEGGA